MPRRTKIVASGNPEMIAELLDCGVNVFRLNFSHGTQDSYRRQAKIIRAVLTKKYSRDYPRGFTRAENSSWRHSRRPNDTARPEQYHPQH
jgi:hypothetical protein